MSESRAVLLDPSLDPFRVWGLALNVRPSVGDVLVVSAGIGAIIIIILLDVIYLFVRSVRKSGKKKRVDCDDGVWLFAMTLAGSFWIYGCLQTSGVLYYDREIEYSCIIYRYYIEYLMGWALWTSLVLYKMICRYYDLRVVRKTVPNSFLVIITLLLPFIVFAVTTNFTMKVKNNLRGAFGVCLYNLRWLYVLLGVSIVYFGVWYILVERLIRRASDTGTSDYNYAMITSFLFLAVDAVIHVLPVLVSKILEKVKPPQITASWIKDKLDFVVIPHQILVITAVIIVLTNLGIIYARVLGPPKVKHRSSICTVGGESSDSINSNLERDERLDAINEAITEYPLMMKDESGVVAGQSCKKAGQGEGILLMNRPMRTRPDEVNPSIESYLDIFDTNSRGMDVEISGRPNFDSNRDVGYHQETEAEINAAATRAKDVFPV